MALGCYEWNPNGVGDQGAIANGNECRGRKAEEMEGPGEDRGDAEWALLQDAMNRNIAKTAPLTLEAA
jgi:hypothetical protein